jgi:hypothetical protein
MRYCLFWKPTATFSCLHTYSLGCCFALPARYWSNHLQELLTFLTQDTTSITTDLSSHMWYCLFCEQQLPGAPLRGCDACPLACHGACYTRTYGQPLTQGPDGRVLCLSCCQDPSLRTIKVGQLVELLLLFCSGAVRKGVQPYVVSLLHCQQVTCVACMSWWQQVRLTPFTEVAQH